MSGGVLLGIGALGGLGALARFVFDGAVAERARTVLPMGTLVVNLSGALVLGVVTGAALHADALRLTATGLLGSYTTFSTWMFETHRLGEDGELGLAVLNVALSLIAGVGAVALGRAIA
jgi:CrcB protein